MKNWPCVLADFVDRADVRMVERGRGASFAAEPLHRGVVLREVFGEELERNAAAEAGVFGLVDHTHASAPELAQDAIVRNQLVDHSSSGLCSKPNFTSAATCRRPWRNAG